MAIRRTAALALIAIGLGGCINQPVVLDRHEVETQPRARTVGGDRCVLPRYEFVDARKHDGMGWIGAHELRYAELGAWLRDSIELAANLDHAASPIIIELNRTYIESRRWGHAFQLVLRARQSDEPESAWRIYRGSVSGITWWGTDAEFGSYVEDAGALAVRSLVRAEGRCTRDQADSSRGPRSG